MLLALASWQEKAAALLQEHRDQGHFLLIITATNRFITAPIAQALGVEDDLGTVEVGKIADLVVLAGDPTEDIKNLRKTEMVVVNGRLLTVAQLLDTQ